MDSCVITNLHHSVLQNVLIIPYFRIILFNPDSAFVCFRCSKFVVFLLFTTRYYLHGG